MCESWASMDDRGVPDMGDDLKLSSESIAKLFHETYEKLAPYFEYTTREASAVPWKDVPRQNKDLMIAVVSKLIDNGVIT